MSGRVDCGECPHVTSGCEEGHCLKATTPLLARDDAAYLRSIASNLTYDNSKGEAVRKHRLNEIAMRIETGGYTPREAP